jgi:hypothetical protein
MATVEDRDVVIVPCADGNLMFVEYNSDTLRCSVLRSVVLGLTDECSARVASGRYGAAAEPTMVDGLVLLGLVRDTYGGVPPIVVLDAATGIRRWDATATDDYVYTRPPRDRQRGNILQWDWGLSPSQTKPSFGNMRTAPRGYCA